jgi:hypothetical protein
MDGEALLIQPTPSFAGGVRRHLIAAALLGWWTALLAIADKLHMLEGEGVEAQFRGCSTTGWCCFYLDGSEKLRRIRPDGIAYASENSPRSVAVRDRLNALLSSMIHQHKRIVLRDLRDAGDRMYSATVIVNEADVAQDEVLRSLQSKPRHKGPQKQMT